MTNFTTSQLEAFTEPYPIKPLVLGANSSVDHYEVTVWEKTVEAEHVTDSLHVLFSDEGHPVAIRKWSKEPFDDAVEYVRKSDCADLIAACDAALDWADANARWFDISTAPRDGAEVLTYPHYRVTSWSNELVGFWFWSDYDDDTVLYNPQPTHWRPLPPPPSNPPLPEALERLGEVLRKVKGA